MYVLCCSGAGYTIKQGFFRPQLRRRMSIQSALTIFCKDVESVGHVASGCTGLAQREYRRRHNVMGLRVYWQLFLKCSVMCAAPSPYLESPYTTQ